MSVALSQTVTPVTHRYMNESPTTIRKGPLRKVVSEAAVTYEIAGYEVTRLREVLECGHVNRIPTDRYGEYTAERRRCRKCRDGLPPDWQVSTAPTQEGTDG